MDLILQLRLSYGLVNKEKIDFTFQHYTKPQAPLLNVFRSIKAQSVHSTSRIDKLTDFTIELSNSRKTAENCGGNLLKPPTETILICYSSSASSQMLQSFQVRSGYQLWSGKLSKFPGIVCLPASFGIAYSPGQHAHCTPALHMLYFGKSILLTTILSYEPRLLTCFLSPTLERTIVEMVLAEWYLRLGRQNVYSSRPHVLRTAKPGPLSIDSYTVSGIFSVLLIDNP